VGELCARLGDAVPLHMYNVHEESAGRQIRCRGRPAAPQQNRDRRRYGFTPGSVRG
jgi:hypothetical protein